MKKKPSNVQKFLRSLDDLIENENSTGRAPRVFKDELFVFCDAAGSRQRRTAEDYVVLGGRSSRTELSENRALASLLPFSASEKKNLCRLTEGGGRFAVIPCGGRAAIVYCGLIGPCRLAVMSLTGHSSEVISHASLGEYSHIFEDTVFFAPASPSGASLRSDIAEFSSDFMSFRDDVLLSCGITPTESENELEGMISAAADFTGCELRFERLESLRGASADRQVAAAMTLSVLSAVRSLSADRCARVALYDSDGDATVTVSFTVADGLRREKMGFVSYCRAVSGLYGIPFAFDCGGGVGRVGFMPIKLDPSRSGLKADTVFDFGMLTERQDFLGAR